MAGDKIDPNAWTLEIGICCKEYYNDSGTFWDDETEHVAFDLIGKVL